MMPGMMRPPIMHGLRPPPNSSTHQTGLTPSLLRLFVSRAPVEYHPPPAKAKKTQPYTGIADYVKLFTDPAEEEDSPPPEPEVKETRAAKKARIAAEKAKENDAKIEEELKGWNPKEDPKLADSDPYKTLFVGRLSYDVDEAKLRREFERFGAVKSVNVVEDREGKPRGYAFVEFERESDMKHAYRSADGLKLEDRRILVDAERGRTVPDWKPRRFGGGLGGTRRGGKTENNLVAGRDQVYHSRPQEGGGYGGQGHGGHQAGYGGQQHGGDRGYGGGDRRDSRRGSSRDSRRDDRDRSHRDSSRYDRRDDRSRDRRDDRRDEDRGRDRYDDRDRRDRDRDRDRRDRDRDRSRGRDRYGYDDRDRGYKRDRSSSRGRRDDRDRDRKRHHGDDGAYPPPPPNGAAAADDDEDKEDGEL